MCVEFFCASIFYMNEECMSLEKAKHFHFLVLTPGRIGVWQLHKQVAGPQHTQGHLKFIFQFICMLFVFVLRLIIIQSIYIPS